MSNSCKEGSQSRIIHKDLEFELLYTKEQIDSTVQKVAKQINNHYGAILSKEENPSVTVLCILKGAFMFFSDLVKYLDFRVECEFLRMSSYFGGLSSSNRIEYENGGQGTMGKFESMFSNRHVLIVEDIVDTGLTMKKLIQRMESESKPKSINIASMVVRPDKQRDVEVKFAGLECRDFIIGYGLDLEEFYRCLPQIYIKVNKESEAGQKKAKQI